MKLSLSTATSTPSAQATYERLSSDRQIYIDRARRCARVTIPSLFPDEEKPTANASLYDPHQSVGARGVNNLAAKLLLNLFPPGTPCFRLTIDDFTLAELTQATDQRALAEERLSIIERAVHNEFETSLLRPALFEAHKQLLVSGNVLLYLPNSGGSRVYRLDRYVVERDSMGSWFKVIIKEEIAFNALPDDIRDMLMSDPSYTDKELPEDRRSEVPVYTVFDRSRNRVTMYQEVRNTRVPGSEGSWRLADSPIIVLRWTRMDGENYGRSYVEEYLGDLSQLEGLSQAIGEASMAAAKALFMVRPNGVTRQQDIAESENLDIITGVADDVSVLQLQKQADMSIASSTASNIEQRVAQAFLLGSSVARNAERVTAEEIRVMVNELETALGGAYTLLSQELQLPLVRRLMSKMETDKRLPKLPEGVVSPTITTGLEALGRGNDVTRLQAFFATLQQSFGPQGMSMINMGDAVKRLGASLGIDMAGLVKSPEQLAQEQQAQMVQQQQLMAAKSVADSVPQVASQVTRGAVEQRLQQG